jgi:hypothetical protein
MIARSNPRACRSKNRFPPSDQVQGHAEALVPYLSMNKQSYVFAVTRELVGEGG